MLDNLREDAASSSLYEEEAKFQSAAGSVPATRARSGRFLGMSAMQRFVIVFMLMLAVCVIGAMALLAFEKVAL